MCQLSIIIPIYNSQEYLRECIESVIAQTYKEIEIILVDDGSTDHSPEICDEYAEKNENIICVHKKNEGLCLARRDGALKARGQFVGFVDSDDTIAKDYYERLMHYQQESGADIVTSGLICDDYTILDNYPEGRYTHEKKEVLYRTMIFDTEKRRSALSCSLCSKVIRKDIYLKVLSKYYTRMTLLEDISYFYRIVLAADCIYISHYLGYYYRQHSNSSSHQYNANSFQNLDKAWSIAINNYRYTNSSINKQLKNLAIFMMFIEFERLIMNARTFNEFKRLLENNDVCKTINSYLRDTEWKIIFTYKEKTKIINILQGKLLSVYLSTKANQIIRKGKQRIKRVIKKRWIN